MNNKTNKILNQINSKEVEGYRYLYDNYYAPLCNFAHKIVGYSDDAEDIVQDVFIKLWKSSSVFKSVPALTSFLYISVKNTSLNAIRDRVSTEQLSTAFEEHNIFAEFEEKNIERLLIEEEYYRQIYVAINNLSPERKETVLLTMQGFTNKEIAEMTGVSVNTVKTLKLKAYRYLRTAISSSAFTFFLYLLK